MGKSGRPVKATCHTPKTKQETSPIGRVSSGVFGGDQLVGDSRKGVPNKITKERSDMILYNYTRLEYLRSILKYGLDKGELCVTPRHYINAVWLTNSLSPRGHGL